ncbi:MAG: cysteine--tRNA ligase [Gammaproteobacteria bacterium]
MVSQSELRIFNSLSGKKELFRPIEPGKVRMYVCGMTVYDYCHLGHARVMVVFDVVARYLRAQGFDVTYARNITDIDDKIIRRAAEQKEPIADLTERFIRYMNEDTAALGVMRPDLEPRATQHIPHIIAMIGRLQANGYAYQADNGDVYFAVGRFAFYGRLSGKQREELRAGARVEIDEAKQDPLDFVLWKSAKPGEPSWGSPWGSGRPGWHIECSAMSTHCLGNHFDIHGGGLDLQFPHHENEIAQSEAATGEPFVNVWMHNGFVRVDEEKMSKSLGNFFTMREVLARYQSEEIRYFILSSHYRSPLNYSDENLHSARNALTRLYLALRDLPHICYQPGGAYEERFHAAMNDDFNTPEALAITFDLAREVNRMKGEEPERAAGLAATLRHLGGFLGLLRFDPEEYLKGWSVTVTPAPGRATVEGGELSVDTISGQEIDRMLHQRDRARKAKDYGEADRIRQDLTARGVILEDTPQGTTWRRQ